MCDPLLSYNHFLDDLIQVQNVLRSSRRTCLYPCLHLPKEESHFTITLKQKSIKPATSIPSYHRLESVCSHSTSKRSISEGKSLDRLHGEKDGWRPLWNHNPNEGQSRLAGESERPRHAHPPERLLVIPVSGWGEGGWQKEHLHSASLNQSYFLPQDPSGCIW